jgi:acyl-CoA synthetase (AMP-forming)/AMP-acid ligase II/thioesterase domain-containing protein/acyl carrier protein
MHALSGAILPLPGVQAVPESIQYSLLSLLQRACGRTPQAVSLLAPGRPALTYEQLLQQVYRTRDALHASGIGRGDRVAVALGDSPEAALLMFGAMASATVTPVNPRLTMQELEVHLRNLRPRAMVVPKDGQSNARDAAAAVGLPLIELVSCANRPAGVFELHGQRNSRDIDRTPCSGDDFALVVQTSGTTGNAKVVPLTHNNLFSMMLANCDVLELTPADRCLSVMPLYHIHGLGAVLCSLLSGGSAVVMPGFSVDPFFDALKEFAPTWYTAVPTIHQAILDRASARMDVVEPIARERRLRIARSGSAPMPKGVPQKLEALFNTMYIEASGATEASAYICSNRVSKRRIGAVGVPMPGTEVRILDENFHPVSGPNVVGELVARGPGIFDGYESNPDATAAAFTPDGFFRTGDLGKYDEDGFFYITGRVKEQINRGGMKVAPNEVDDILLRHPAVAQAATFAMPNARLGDEVAAAVVLRTGHAATELELQRHTASLLADYKVPRKIVVLDEILKGPSGKIIRVGLAKKLGLDVQTDVASAPTTRQVHEPYTAAEQVLASIWSDALGRNVDDVETPFFAYGGDSLQAARVSVAVEKRFGRFFPLAALFTFPTIRAMARMLEGDGWKAQPGAPIVLHEGEKNSSLPPLFVLPGMGGNVYSYYTVIRELPQARRVIGFPLPGADGLEPTMPTVQQVAERFVEFVKAEQPTGPYVFVGYSLGGRIGFEMLSRLSGNGTLVMIDTPAPGWPPPLPFVQRVGIHMRRAMKEGLAATARRAISKFRGTGEHLVPDDILRAAQLPLGVSDDAAKKRQDALVFNYLKAAFHWRAPKAGFPMILFRAATEVRKDADTSDRAMGWGKLTSGGVRVIEIPGTHGSVFHEPHVRELAKKLTQIF